MGAWTIIVEFETKDGCEDEFLALIRDHARRTLSEEPGCKRFEVIRAVERDGSLIPGLILVNELYADEAAVSAHEANPRMPSLGTAMAPLLKSRRLIRAVATDAGEETRSLRPEQLNAANDD